jgi:hypothetical protein
MVTFFSWKLRVLVVAILRVHHLDEEDRVTFPWNSLQSKSEVSSHIGNDVFVVLVVCPVCVTNLRNTKLYKLHSVRVLATVCRWLREGIHIEDIFSLAHQIGDSQFKYEEFTSEYDEGFYKFRAWWGENENRTAVFLADIIQNKIFFYSMWNEYPKHFLTTKHDVNETIAIYGSDPDYHFSGDYYIRLRPDFALYDLMSQREYIFNMYAFSQPPANGGEYPNGM